MQRQFSRRLKMKTNYNTRLSLLKSGKPRFVVKKTLNYIHIQIIKYSNIGDSTIVEITSKNLKKIGWKFHCGNLSAAYLTGLLVGREALKNGIKEAVCDIGLQRSIKGSVLYAACKGAVDAGLDMPIGDVILPDEKRIRGDHIANYAKLLKKDSELYKKQFSKYIKNNHDPENIPKHFDEIKNKIISSK